MNEQQVFEAVFKATGVSDFEKAIAGAQDSIKSFESASKKIRDTGKTLTTAVTLPLVGLGVASGKVASDFETAMTGVAKTTDLTAQEFSDMEDAILEMTRVIPASATEIAGVAEAAGQLGIEKENILGFTETMVNLGVATNMSAEEAATSLARLANITGMPQTEFDKLGSVIVELGNNLATTEGEIVEMGLRLAGTASQVGLTEAEIMALAGAMSSVGISAEAGGTAMSTVMQKINTSVLSGSEEISGFAKVAGMSAEDFATAWEDSPQTAITAFIEGLGGMNAEGVDTVTMLKDLGISGIREVDTLNRLSGASGLLAESFGMASGAWEENTALSEEAQTAYETTANKIQLAKNAIVEAGIALGDHLLPYVQQVAEFVADLAQRFSDLNPAIQITTIVIGAIVAAIGPLLMLIGQMGMGVSALGKFFIGTAGGTSAFATVLSALSSPITAVIVAIGAFIGVLIYLYNTNEVVRDRIDTAWQFIKDVITNVSQAISGFVMSIWGRIQNWLTANQDAIRSAVDTAWNAIVTIVDTIMAVVVPLVQTGWEAIKVATEVVWNVIKAVVEVAITTVLAIIQTVMQVIEGDWSGAWETIKGLVLEVWEIIVDYASIIFGTLKEFFVNLWESVKEVFSTAWNGIKEYLVELWNSIKESAASIWESIWTTISEASSNAWNAIVEWFGGLPEWFSETWNTIVEGVTTWASNMITKAIEVGTQFLEAITTFFSELPYNVGFFLGEVIGTVIKWGIGMGLKAYETGSTFVSNLIEWIQQLPGRIANWLSNAYERVTTWASNMWNKAKETGRNFINGIIEWLQQLPGRVQQWLSNTLSRVSTWASNMASKARDAGSRFLQNVSTFVSQLPGKIANWLNQVISRLASWVSEMASKGREAGSRLVSAVTNAVQSLPGKMVSFGKDVVRGFWNGITSLGGWIKGKVSSFFSGIVDGAKSALKIFSPSRVFRDEVGKMVVKGFGLGIEQNEKEAVRPMERMLDNVIGVFDSQTSGLGATFSVTGDSNIASAMNRALDVDMPMVNGRVNHSVNMNNGRTENLLEQLVNSNQVIVLDSGELVGATYPQYDRVGGNQTQLTERWGR